MSFKTSPRHCPTIHFPRRQLHDSSSSSPETCCQSPQIIMQPPSIPSIVCFGLEEPLFSADPVLTSTLNPQPRGHPRSRPVADNPGWTHSAPPLPPVPSYIGSPRLLDASGNLLPPTFSTTFPWAPPHAGPVDYGLSSPLAPNLDQLINGL